MKSRQPTDAIALLKADHRAVEELFDKYEKATASDRKSTLAEQICMELAIHTLIEEEIFYPACREAGVESDTMDEANVEHDGTKVLVAELKAGDVGDEYYDAKVKVLSEMVKHHIKEEERRSEGIFAQAREKNVDIEALGEELAQRKEELKMQFESQGLPKPTAQTYQAVALG
jgi:hemerythrin superfamily protein